MSIVLHNTDPRRPIQANGGRDLDEQMTLEATLTPSITVPTTAPATPASILASTRATPASTSAPGSTVAKTLCPAKSKLSAYFEFQTPDFDRHVSDSDEDAPTAREIHPTIVQQALVHHHTLTNEVRKRLLDSLRYGRLCLVDTVLGLRGLPHAPWLDSRRGYKNTISMHMTELLCSISTALIVKLIMGNLPWMSKTDEATSFELAAIAKMKNPTPGIYVMYLVDEYGLGPSWREWALVLDAIEKYASIGDEADDLASRIDGVRHSRKTNIIYDNRRKYLLADADKKKPDMAWSHERRRVLLEFVRRVRDRIEAAAGEGMDTRHRRPFSEVGYGINPESRIQSHRRHESTNFLMAICSATFEIVHPTCAFRLEGHTVCRAHRLEHASTGEVLFSALTQAYVTHGTGFSHHSAGISNCSAEGVQYMRWRELQGIVMSNPRYVDRMNAAISEAGDAVTGRSSTTGGRAVAGPGRAVERRGTVARQAIEERSTVEGRGAIERLVVTGRGSNKDMTDMAATAAKNWRNVEKGIAFYGAFVARISDLSI